MVAMGMHEPGVFFALLQMVTIRFREASKSFIERETAFLV